VIVATETGLRFGVQERPILFRAEMVRAILDGRKTQTRRVVKPATIKLLEAARQAGEVEYPPENAGDDKYIAQFCPHGQPGDRLWVRETFCTSRRTVNKPTGDFQCNRVRGLWEFSIFRERVMRPEDYRWKPSIFMPRWASRIALEITGVRVERVQDISEKDAIAEGVRAPDARRWTCNAKLTPQADAFAVLWDSINAKRDYSWESNPWVWVISFNRVQS
jgi:hypothetical protein